MKIKLLSLLAIIVIGWSCTRDNSEIPADPNSGEKEKVPFTVNVSDFVRKVENMDKDGNARVAGGSLRDSLLHQKVTDIYFMVYNPPLGAYHVEFVHQNRITDSLNFGTYTDTLYSGDYRLFVFASKTPLSFSVWNNSPYLVTRQKQLDTCFAFNEVFYHKSDLILGRGNTPVITPELTRVVGNLKVEVQDGAVNQFYDISVLVNSENQGTFIDDLTTMKDDMFDNKYFVNLTRRSPTEFSDHIVNTTRPMTVTITAKHRVTGHTIVKTLTNIYCLKNKQTTITGSLGVPGTMIRDFEISVNDAWSNDDNHIPF